MGLSPDVRARQRQLDNLRPLTRLEHGTNSQRLLETLRERHRAGLTQDYPRIDSRRLGLRSDLVAEIELAGSYLDRRGLVTDRRTPELRPIVRDLSACRSRRGRCSASCRRWTSRTDRTRSM